MPISSEIIVTIVIGGPSLFFAALTWWESRKNRVPNNINIDNIELGMQTPLVQYEHAENIPQHTYYPLQTLPWSYYSAQQRRMNFASLLALSVEDHHYLGTWSSVSQTARPRRPPGSQRYVPTV